MESKKYDLIVATNQMLMQFMFCFHWLINYTGFNDEEFTEITDPSDNEEYVIEYIKELVDKTYGNLDKFLKLSFYSDYIFRYIKYLNPLILKSSILKVKWHDDDYLILDDEYKEIIKLIHSKDEKICSAYNWLISWRSLK